MYAIVETGGKQYRVSPNDVIDVEKLDLPEGSICELDKVLMVAKDNGETLVGRPYVEGAVVVAKVVGHGRGPKILGFKYKPKKRYRRRWGHRQWFTRLKIEEIRLPGEGEASPPPEGEEGGE